MLPFIDKAVCFQLCSVKHRPIQKIAICTVVQVAQPLIRTVSDVIDADVESVERHIQPEPEEEFSPY